MNRKQLLEQRGDLVKANDTLLETAQNESRSLNADEIVSFDANEATAEEITQTLERMASQRSRRNIVNVGNNRHGESGEQAKIAKRYSITDAIQQQLGGGAKNGLVAEMHEQAKSENREFGKDLEGVGMPSFLIQPIQKRDLTVGTATQIGNTVATEVGEMIPFLQPRLKAMELGATMMTGLTSNLSIPRNNAIGAASWEGETDENAETNLTTDVIALAPKRLGALMDYTKQLLLQSSVSVDNLVRNDLQRAIAIALDYSAINGSGSSNQPTGILNTAGIGDVSMGTNGGVATRAKLVDLVSKLATANADMGALAFLTTPGIRGKLQQTLLDAGSGRFVWETPNELLGYNAQVSTQVPSTLTKGSSSICHAIIYANWEELMIAQWGGIDLLVDPYTLGNKAMVRVIVNSYWDIALRHATSFAAIKDALI
jgi:HK97 family phage major capsid protein